MLTFVFEKIEGDNVSAVICNNFMNALDSKAWPVDASNISFSNPASCCANGPNMMDGS